MELFTGGHERCVTLQAAALAGRAKEHAGSMNSCSAVVVRLLEEYGQPSALPGQALPSIRELAEHHAVSVGLMVKALRVLASQGVLRHRPGVGYQIAEPFRERRMVVFAAYGHDPDVALLAQGLDGVLREHGLSCTTIQMSSDLERYRALPTELAQLQPDGVVIQVLPQQVQEMDWTPLIRSRVPLVAVGCQEGDIIPGDGVVYSGLDAGETLARAILDRGQPQDPWLVLSGPLDAFKLDLAAALDAGLAPAGASALNIIHHEDVAGWRGGPAFSDLLADLTERATAGWRPDLLIFCHDYPAAAALPILERHGLAGPGRLWSAMRCGDPALSLGSGERGAGSGERGRQPQWPFPAWDPRREHLGRRAAQLLLRRIRGQRGPWEFHYPGGCLHLQ